MTEPSDHADQLWPPEHPVRPVRSPSDQAPAGPSFGELLKAHRTRRGLSQSALARQVGVDASYLNRLEAASREPPKRPLVVALADALALPEAAADALLVAAGHLPRAIHQAIDALGPLDPTLRLVAAVLADEAIPQRERDEFREIVRLVARRWPAHARSAPVHPTAREATP